MHRAHLAVLPLLAALVSSPAFAAGAKGGPSRRAEKGCAWEKLSDARLGLEAWVSRCDFGFRKIDFVVKGDSLAQKWSDGGEPEPVVDVYALEKGEAPAAGIRRVFAARTEKGLAARCVLAPYRRVKARAGVKLYSFVPDAKYAKEVAAKAKPDEIGDPPCGELGDGPEGVQYFEVHEGAPRFLFVRVGQEEPLFDEKTLRLLPAR